MLTTGEDKDLDQRCVNRVKSKVRCAQRSRQGECLVTLTEMRLCFVPQTNLGNKSLNAFDPRTSQKTALARWQDTVRSGAGRACGAPAVAGLGGPDRRSFAQSYA